MNSGLPQIYYEHKGQGAKKALFIHGNMGSTRWWRPVMEVLSDSLDMVAVDLRGYGRSPDGPPDVQLADHARDIAEIVGIIDFQPVILVGHSLGGAVAMQFAADYPSLVAGMVLVDSAPLGGLKNIDYNLLSMVSNNQEILIASLKGTMAANIDQAYFAELAEDCLRSVPAIIPNTRALDGADFSTGAGLFDKPVLVVHGEKDALVPVCEAERLSAGYPQGNLIIIPGVGHNPQVENTPDFSRILVDFVNEL